MNDGTVVYVVEWVAVYGDEGEGREVCFVTPDQELADRWQRNTVPPKGFSRNGAYEIHEAEWVTK